MKGPTDPQRLIEELWGEVLKLQDMVERLAQRLDKHIDLHIMQDARKAYDGRPSELRHNPLKPPGEEGAP